MIIVASLPAIMNQCGWLAVMSGVERTFSGQVKEISASNLHLGWMVF
jgi:hypothetical protein